MNSRQTRDLEPTLDPTPGLGGDHLEAFGREIDDIRRDIESQVGDADLRHVRRLDRVSRSLEVTGRALLHFSFEPLTFMGGVVALWLHKQLQATEIGHPALHGAYDKIPGVGRFHSERFRWDVPIEESSWRRSHNVEHHQYTNIVGRDPDVEFGAVRLNAEVPFKSRNRRQLVHTAWTWLGLGLSMNLHATGLDAIYLGDRKPPAGERLREWWRLHRLSGRKLLPYWFWNYVFFPALAGPMFWKVLLGNWMAETMRNLYTAASIFCGHIGADVSAYPEGTRARSRAQWYAMQVKSANDFRVPWPLSVLCGGLEHQIEHHLFPKLPPERLRQIAPRVQAVCERYGLPYRNDTWWATLRGALGDLGRLQSPAAARLG
jgi:NADPH-dependent stearoyl-CoA 9-desaturase